MRIRHLSLLFFISILLLIAVVGIFSKKQVIHTKADANTQIVVNHNSIELFEQIPSEYLDAARNLRVLFSDRSVGQNINESLNCLSSAQDWWRSPAFCRRDYYDGWNWKTYSQTDYNNGNVPQRILFDPDPVIYNRTNWEFVLKGGTWTELTQDFVQALVPSQIDTKDVLSYQFSYLNVGGSESIADPTCGFFARGEKSGCTTAEKEWGIEKIEALEAQYPDKVFIYWTTSLARSAGTESSTEFNRQMREYTAANNKVLFDFADIESHTDIGVACFDNRDGVYYSNGNNWENHPDDGVDHPAICQDYTTETEGGHLGSVSAGRIRAAKAFWVLTAMIAGWKPDGLPSLPSNAPTLSESAATTTSTPTPTVSSQPSLTPTSTLTPSPTVSGTTFDLTATPACSTIYLSWPSLENAASYFLDRCPDTLSLCGGKWTQLLIGSTNLSYTDSGVINDNLYTYRLRARFPDRSFTQYYYQSATPTCN